MGKPPMTVLFLSIDFGNEGQESLKLQQEDCT